MTTTSLPLAHVLPVSAAVNAAGRLEVGGCDVRELADRFGTPLSAADTLARWLEKAPLLRRN